MDDPQIYLKIYDLDGTTMLHETGIITDPFSISGYGSIEPIHSSVLGTYISEERNMLITQKIY